MRKRIHDIAFKVFDEFNPADQGRTYVQVDIDKFSELIIQAHVESMTKAWYATGQDIRGGKITEFLEKTQENFEDYE